MTIELAFLVLLVIFLAKMFLSRVLFATVTLPREQKEKFREAQQDLEGKLASLSQMIHSGEARALQIA